MITGSPTNDQQLLSKVAAILAARNAPPLLATKLASNQLTPNDRISIIEIIAAELSEKGFNVNSEPTAYGLELELMIDYLNRPNLK